MSAVNTSTFGSSIDSSNTSAAAADSFFISFIQHILPTAISRLLVGIQDYTISMFDSCIYYVINGVMIIMALADVLLEFSDKVMYNYEICLQFFKHEMYKNIN